MLHFQITQIPCSQINLLKKINIHINHDLSLVDNNLRLNKITLNADKTEKVVLKSGDKLPNVSTFE